MPHDDHDPAEHDALVLLRALRADMPAPAPALRHVFDRLGNSLPADALQPTGDTTAELARDPSSPGDVDSTGVAGSVGVARPVGGAAPVGVAGPVGGPGPVGVADPVGVAASRGALAHGAVTVAKPWAWALGLTLAGGATGGALHAVFAPEKVRIVYVERRPDEGTSASGARDPHDHRAPSPAAVIASPPVQRDPPPAGPIASEPPFPSEPTAPQGSTAAGSNFSKERMLLDGARRHLAAGEPEACLAEIGKHARAFPSGKLAEEREALAVNALVSVGRYAQAREKAALFTRRYPHSFLAPSVEAAISAIP